MGQHAAASHSAAEVADVATYFAQDEAAAEGEALEEALEEIVGKDCPAGTQANAAKFNAECSACPAGKHKMYDGKTMCADCPGGTFAEDEGRSVPCEMCDVGSFSAGGATECRAFTECPNVAGVKTAGTPSSDVRCDNCQYGFNTLSSDYSSPCFQMSDLDGDGLFDRLPPAWEEGMEFDTRETPPSGGEFDPCPFDEYNDRDGDGICDGVAPLVFWKSHLEENSPALYPRGAWRVDQCPSDPDNNADKDRKFDNRSEDDKVISWDFYSNDLAGWTNKKDVFEVNVVDEEVPQLDARRFIFDERVVEVCEKSTEHIEAMFSITRGRYDWTETDETIVEMYKQLTRLQELREAEKDERWRAQYKEDIEAFEQEIVDAKDQVRYIAHQAKYALHDLEKQRDELEDQLEAAERHAEVAGENDELFQGETVDELAHALHAKKHEIDLAKDDLPPEIAEMDMKNFLPPTCEKLCMDHNLVCTSGKIVYNKQEGDDGEVSNEEDLAMNEIQAVREDLAERMKYHADCTIWKDQACIKKLPRCGELKDELIMVQHETEELTGRKRELENAVSSCSPANQERDAADNEAREERLEIEYKKAYAKREGLETALAAGEKALKLANADDETRQASILIAMVKDEMRELEHEISRLDFARTGCLDPAEESAEHLQCVCSYDPEPVKEETWSMSTVCTTCFAANKRGETGFMGTSIKIKKGVMRFAMLGAPSLTNFVKITILDKDTALVAGKMPGPRLTEGRPFYQESVSNELPVDADGNVGEPQWYPVEWDLSEFLGRDAVVQVSHYDKDNQMAVDDFEFFDDYVGCLPTCMSVRDGVCNGGDETCFYFEEDMVPYVQVKSAGHAKGTYCRASFGPGSKLGPGIISMGYDYADWTDTDPTIIPLLEEREDMVMQHDAEKFEWLRKEKERGQKTDWMMTSSEMKVELSKIDEKWFELILEQDRKITAQRNLRKDMARNMTMIIDDFQLEIAQAYADQAYVRGDFDKLMNDPDMLELRERDSDNDGVADEPNRLQQKDAEYDALITELKNSRIAKQIELEEIVGEDAGWAGATLDYLAVRHLPRCIYLEMRGSHYAISLPTPGNTLWAYAPEVSLDNGSVMGTHCVYNSIKPRCVTHCVYNSIKP